MPLGALARLQCHHAGVHLAPLLAERVGEVVLVLDGYKFRGWRSVHLDCFDFRGNPFDIDSVVRRRIDYLDRYHAILPIEMTPVIVEEFLGQRYAAGSAEVIAGSLYRRQLPGGEDIV